MTFSMNTLCCQLCSELAATAAPSPSPSTSQPSGGAQCSRQAASAYAAISAGGRASQAGNLRRFASAALLAVAWFAWVSGFCVMCASRTMEPVASSVGMCAPLTGTSSNLPAGASSRRSCARY